MKNKILLAEETHTYKKSGFWDNKIIKKAKQLFTMANKIKRKKQEVSSEKNLKTF